MRVHAVSIIVLIIVFLGIDAIWLGFVSVGFYQKAIGHLLAENPDLVAAAFFYVIYLAGVFYFAVLPGLRAASPRTAAIKGGLFGLVAYATYDLTNMATLKDWPLGVTLADLAWGTFLTGLAATASVFAATRLAR